jgi:hypothetical protein
MGFKVRKTDYRAWPVTVRLQECDAAGNVAEIEQTFVAHFKPFSEAENAQIVAEIEQRYPPRAEGEPVNLSETLKRNAMYFGRVIVGWGPEVTDDSGVPLKFSQEALAQLITGPDGLAISAALSHAVGQLRYGIAPAKNLNASPSPGEASGVSEAETSSPAT